MCVCVCVCVLFLLYKLGKKRQKKIPGIHLSRAPVTVSRSLQVPPGRHVVRFACDGESVTTAEDPRVLVWRIQDLRVRDEMP